ncbi:MAG TPA: hypothetical protein VK787_03315 [Puia sp.]|jgi:hypothetical protein|nr:hypothetical protein [Puia sp.]
MKVFYPNNLSKIIFKMHGQTEALPLLVLCVGFVPGTPATIFRNAVVGAANAHAYTNANNGEKFYPNRF